MKDENSGYRTKEPHRKINHTDTASGIRYLYRNRCEKWNAAKEISDIPDRGIGSPLRSNTYSAVSEE